MSSVSTLDHKQYQDWQNYVAQHNNASCYHDYAWGQAIQAAYGHKAHYFIAKEEQQTVGILPVIEIRKPLLGRELCSLPFCDLGGCLADNPGIEEQLIQHASRHLAACSKTPLQLRQSGQSVVDSEADRIEGKKVRMLLPLPDSSEELMASFKSKLRSQIRKAEKNGLTVELGQNQLLIDDFYTVFAQNMHMLGSPVHGKPLFEALLNEYQEKMLICTVKNESLVIGAGIVLMGKHTVSIPWASTLQKYNKLAPNMLLYWSLLKEVTDRGFSQFDFGRSSYGEGTYKFKQQWGAKPVLLAWQQYPQTSPQDEAPSTSGKLRELVENTWRKLPLSATTTLGPKIRKYISL